MVLSVEDDQEVEQRFYDLCADLNMDRNTSTEAWQTFLRIGHNYTLEGDPVHWLVCALYVACRSSTVPTVGGRPGAIIEGNCVSLTRLLRSCKLSLLQFFTKMKKWADMASLPQDFRKKIDRLEKNFAVSHVIFKKFKPIYFDTFKKPSDEAPRVRSRKQKRLPCTSAEVFSFCWTLFIQVKSNFTAISDDLVNSYHLLLSCVDYVFNNILLADRRDLLNLEFSGLPDDFNKADYKPPTEHTCIIRLLCEKHDGLFIEAKTIKEHWWKPYIKTLFNKKLLKGNFDTLAGLLDLGNFETNNKSVNNSYETYVLNVGDFDERIFLVDEANNEIGMPARSLALTGDLVEKMQVKRNLQQHLDTVKSLNPLTPLTNRRYLMDKEVGNVTPVSTATQSVTKLQTLLSGRKTSPSDTLIDIFKECSRNPMDSILKLIKDMGEKFCTFYVQPSDEHLGSHIDFAKKRLQLGECLYYKTLESNMLMEKKRLPASFDFSSLLEQDVFHKSLFACCLEIVIFSYNSQRIFPWIIGIFEIEPYYFYKVIEVLIRAEEGLSRDVVKHLNHIEEQIFESLAWKSDSLLWAAIRNSGQPIPTCEEVSLQYPSEQNSNPIGHHQLLSSPVPHPSIRRLALDRSMTKGPQQSPLAPSLADRFQSPNANGTVNSAKRRLFAPVTVSRAVTVTTPTTTLGNKSVTGETVLLSTASGATTVLSPQKTLTFVQSQGEGGCITYIPTQYLTIPISSASITSTLNASNPTTPIDAKKICPRPKRIGSLGLFFRKFYHLAGVRLRDLYERLEITDEERRKKFWTCFEHCIIHHTDLMMDRHLDQILMCSIYIMDKVGRNNTAFQDIMRCYRAQPQAASHVYRSVLLFTKERHGSGSSSDGSKNETSESNSPVPMDKEEDDKRKLRLAIRSSSTLPADHLSYSQPQTPTQLAGTSSSFKFEDRGDLITFYNKVYGHRMQSFVLKFTEASTRNTGNPPLSPLPMPKSYNMSPRRQVSSQHSVFISPLRSAPSPNRSLAYSFSQSPSKNLQAINNMVRLGSDEPPAKRACLDLTLKRIQSVITERQGARGAPAENQNGETVEAVA